MYIYDDKNNSFCNYSNLCPKPILNIFFQINQFFLIKSFEYYPLVNRLLSRLF